MSKIKSRILRIVAVVLSAFGITSTFTACYGMPVDFEDLADIELFVYGDKNNNNIKDEDEKFLSGVVVRSNDGRTKTDENGYASLYYHYDEEAEFYFTVDPESKNFIWENASYDIKQIEDFNYMIPLKRSNAEL